MTFVPSFRHAVRHGPENGLGTPSPAARKTSLSNLADTGRLCLHKQPPS
ncbi:hypothetical protein SEA_CALLINALLBARBZ_49 [Arthrobacter phage CallinAllBarbz]|uniref:Uncharacterized protein n=1 Tax=Arthrobacter phage CallinAllBarbz TaxID=3077790 RepID=A0AA96KAG6_9CAUD|nr:hypothetical protein SEA_CALLINALLBARBZ_49 [Arthrobacter phage CallinAllBarbz]